MLTLPIINRKFKAIFFISLLTVFVILMSGIITYSFDERESMIEFYPIPANTQASSTYSVSINGQPAFVEKYNSLSYVHFAFVGKANLEITVKGKVNNYTLSPKSHNIQYYTLSPKSYNIQSRKNGNKIFFSLTEPHKLILHNVNSLDEKLFILAEPPEESLPKLEDTNTINVMNYGVDNTGIQDATLTIQQAIDKVSAQQGLLYFPPGIYKIQQLNLRSNMTLYLAGGTVLEANQEINPSFGHGLINLENVSNVTIRGRGVINGNGSYWRPRGGWYSLIGVKNTTNFVLQDIILKDPAVANVWLAYSDNSTIYNAKVLADPNPEFINTDGFVFWSSRNITLDNVLYKGTDDATALKGDKNGWIENTENINIKNAVFYGGNGFKIGTEVKQDFVRNITYENIDIVFANELSGFWPITGANFENIYFKNIRVEDILDTPEKDKSASLFQWRIMAGSWEPDSSTNKLGYIRNVYINNMIVDDQGGGNSIFEGYDSQSNIKNVTFDNLIIEGKLVTKLEEAFFTFLPSKKDGRNYVGLKFTKSDS